MAAFDRRLATGAFWVFAAEAAGGALSLLSTVVSARVLQPVEFGLMATVVLTMAVLDALSQTGFEQALIQRQKDVDRLLDSAWSLQLLRGLVLALLFAVISPWLARFYREPRLEPIMLVASGVLLLRGCQSLGPVLFSRELDFRRQFGIKVAQALASAFVYIPAVLLLRNVWALCVSLLVGALLSTVISFAAHPYRPRFALDRGSVRELFSFGKWVSWSAALVFIATQGDDLFVSKYLGFAALGLYQMAYGISNLPATQISHVISRVTFPAYSKLLSEPPQLKALFGRVLRSTMLLALPVSVVIWFLIPDLVRYVIGDKWSGIVPLVRVLIIAGLARAFAATGGALFQAMGRPELDFRMQVPRFVVLVLLLWPAAAQWGVTGVCAVCLASILACLPQWALGVRELLGVRFKDLVAYCAPAVAVTAVLSVLLGAAQLVDHVALRLAGLVVWAGLVWRMSRIWGVDLNEVRALLRGPSA